MLFKSIKGNYFGYLIAFLVLFALYPITKTVLDFSMLLKTGRFIGTEDWIEVAYNHRERLSSNTSPDQPRILVIGGSSSLFGISAQQISEATGIQALNFSTHAGLGSDYILKRAEPLVRPGDIVLISIEYPLYLQPNISQDFRKREVLNRFILTHDRSRLQQISLVSKLGFVFDNAFSMGVFSRASRLQYEAFFKGQLTKENISTRLKTRGESGECYNGYSLNEYGDESCTIGKDNEPTLPRVVSTALLPGMRNLDPSDTIRHFVDSMKAKDVTVIPLLPTTTYTEDYSRPPYQASISSIKSYWESLGIDFRDSLEKSLLPQDMMFDSRYHPDDSGRYQRTKAIIEIIDSYLPREDKNSVSDLQP